MDKSLYLFENDHGFVTNDGRLHQKDNSWFSGRELAVCTEENRDEIVGYYIKAFENLEKYAKGFLAALETADADSAAQREKLAEEIKKTDALGDFDSLLSQVVPATEATSLQEEQDVQVESADGSETADEHTTAIAADEAPSEAKATEAEEVNPEPASDAKAPHTESESAEETADDKESDFPVSMPEVPTEASDVLKEYVQLTEKALEFAQSDDFALANSEFANLKHKWDIAESVSSEAEEELRTYNSLFKAFQQAEQYLAERRNEHHQKMMERRQKNLARRQEIVDRLKAVIENEKWQSFGEVKSLQRKWEGVRAVKNEEGEKQQTEFDRLLAVFEEKKVEILVERRQKEEENYTVKLTILDKINQVTQKVAEEGFDNWDNADREIQELSRQWRKIGRVPKEQSDQTWDKFRTATDAYYEAKFQHNEAYRKELLRNVEKRKKLIEEAKQLTEEEDLALAARKANQLHRRWKKIGQVPKEENDKLWEEFKTASDSFNEVKSDNLDLIKEQEQENLDKKNALIEKALKIAEEQDWKRGSQQLQELMEAWKEIGPPPRRKAAKTWKKFKEAMDAYYKPRREHFKNVKNEQKENLAKKKEIIEQIAALNEIEDAQEAVQKIKPLQQAFNDIGFVPIKKKDEMYQQYKEACDSVYQRARASTGNLPGTRHMEFADGVSADEKKEARLKQVEVNKLKKEFEKLNDEILRLGDTKTFIKPNKKGLLLREEIQQKIDAAEEQKSKLDKKISDIQRDISKVQS